MDAKQAPILIDNRQGERRAGWHTPDDCAKLLSTQTAIANLSKRMEDGSARMWSIESLIKANAEASAADRDLIKQTILENSILAAQDRDHIKQTLTAMQEPMEIIGSLKGFARGVIATGKWTRRIIMFLAVPAAAIFSLITAYQGLIR